MSTRQQDPQANDPFEDLFNLEDHHYAAGYNAGFADGAAQSAIEARIFGIEKGFEKFLVMGKLRRQAEVWAEKYGLPSASITTHSASLDTRENGISDEKRIDEVETTETEQTEPKSRLQRHIETLLLLTDPATLDKSNTDEAVAVFDDRVKRAQAKVKVVESIVGEDKASRLADGAPSALSTGAGTSATADIENLKLKPG